MKFEDFVSGKYKQQFQYKSFTPTKVNHEWTWDDARINVLLEEATRMLGELNAFTLIVPDIDRFIRMHIAKEANTSSRIEGTRTNMDEVVLTEDDILPERRDDWREVQNYIKAMGVAIENLKELPLSLRLLKQTHATLLTSVRGASKLPGEFRTSQNWIGGASISDAAFVPPHHLELPDLLSDLEAFWHNDTIQVPHLIRIAISHYQFETIHPFLDGNGRIGRLLITLYLVSHGLLEMPSLYLSAFFEKYRTAYYDALSRVRESNDIGHWCRFFLKAIIEISKSGKQTFTNIFALQKSVDGQLLTLGRRVANGQKLILELYKNPVITSQDVMRICGIQYNPANNLIKVLCEVGILKEGTGYQRNRIFVFTKYMDIFHSDEGS
jgi:Fic family protein